MLHEAEGNLSDAIKLIKKACDFSSPEKLVSKLLNLGAVLTLFV